MTILIEIDFPFFSSKLRISINFLFKCFFSFYVLQKSTKNFLNKHLCISYFQNKTQRRVRDQ